MNENNKLSNQTIKQKYNNARSNLLLMIIFTLVNIALYIFGSGTMFLFSATIPYLSMIFGMMLADSLFMAMFFAVSKGSIILYFLCWIFSKKHVTWMIVALVLFVIDTLAMVGIYVFIADVTGVMDLLMHIWILYYLIMGVSYGFKMKKLPDDEEITEEASVVPENGSLDTTPICIAETSSKVRILLEDSSNGHNICYRRLNHTNELVIDGYVYAKCEGIFESPHVLSANLSGHLYEAGYDGMRSFIRIDSGVIKRKIRLW